MKTNSINSRPVLCVFSALLVAVTLISPAISQDDIRQRKFTFTYGASIDQLPEKSKVRIWIPVAQSNNYQKVKIVSLTLPGEAKVTEDKKYGNKMFFLEMVQSGNGRVAFQIKYEVERREATSSGKLTEEQRGDLDKFLLPNELVPVDGKPVDTFKNFLQEESLTIPDDPLASGRIFYNFVEDHLKYDKSKPGYGTGNSVWACDSRTGNCTDFHSLFISVARANRIPAQFRIGFPLPEKRGRGSIGGYHCWAFFHAEEQGWTPVDISEADKDPSRKDYYFGKLSESRIQFTTGRDIMLEPPQQAKPLNYFVYPHVEVDGKVWSKDKTKMILKYRDISG